MVQTDSVITSAYIVPGQPHILLAHDKSPYWQSLYDSYAKVREEIANQDADLILYYSTQWLSVIGYMFQADPAPEWLHVDHNWHDLGSMPYKFRVDSEFSKAYAEEVKKLGHNVKAVNYKGFPIDTGTIVAQKLLNPDNKFPASMVSCNMYSEKLENIEIGRAAFKALEKQGKKAIAVLVSNLSSRFTVTEIDPLQDKLSSAKDNEWNLKILELLGEGRLEDVSQVMREFSRQANADMGGKGFWWLNGLCGESNDFNGKVFDYQPVWGTGAALAGLYPLKTKKITFEVDTDEAAPVSDDRKIYSENAPEPVGPYPHARRHNGMIYVSGIGPRKKGSKTIPGVTMDEHGKITDHDIEIQTRSVIENIRAILEDAGSSLEKVIDVQVFLTDIERDFKKFNAVYNEFFGKIQPSRTTVCVTSLPTPIAVELKVIAEE